MQVNGINSHSAPKMAFKGEGAEEKKGINKKAAIAAGVGAAAVAAGTIALGIHGKKIAGADVDAKGIKKAFAFVKTGAEDVYNAVKKFASDTIENIKEKTRKPEETPAAQVEIPTEAPAEMV